MLNTCLTPNISIYIATCDRLDFLIEAIQSCVNQDFDGCYNIVVSDNSSRDDTEKLFSRSTVGVQYVRRKPQLHPIDHFNQIISECSTKYLTIFHDDDVLCSEYIKTMSQILDENPGICGVGCNSFYLNGTEISADVIRKSNRIEIVKQPSDLVNQYLTINSSGPPPFSGYMYRVSKIREFKINKNDAGKYSDLAFLIRIVKNNSLFWHPNPLMYYRIHNNNDSKSEIIGQRLRLTRFLYLNNIIKRKSKIADEIRFLNWYRWCKTRRGLILGAGLKQSRKDITVLKHLAFYSLTKLLFNNFFWKKVFRKARGEIS